jgi:predicted dehydrogenase
LRLERKLGARLHVVGLVDPDKKRSEAVLNAKRSTLSATAYANTRVFASLQEATSALSQTPPQIIVLGSPPAFRGRISHDKGLDAEKTLSDAFPKAGLFVEKPVSTGSVEEAKSVADLLESRKEGIVSVGYMLRYSAAVQRMKNIIQENQLTVMMTSARYVMGKSALQLPRAHGQPTSSAENLHGGTRLLIVVRSLNKRLTSWTYRDTLVVKSG